MKKFFILLALAAPLAAQHVRPDGVVELDETPLFKAETVSRTTQAINYERTGSSTRVDFTGTAIMPAVEGRARVKQVRSVLSLDIELKKMEPASTFGAEYLTYVVWAISPDGRATNLGEVLLNKNGKGKLTATTELQIFGMVVTAEPYFAVRVPSDLIVAQNEARKDTRGKLYFIDAKFELLKRGQYAALANPLELSINLKDSPLEMYEARNAVEVARSSGAEHFAPKVFRKAEASLEMAEGFPKRDKRYRAEVVRTARQAVQFAEDARELAVKREEEARLAAERKASAEREAAANAAAEAEMILRAEAEAARKAEEEARMRAEQRSLEDATKRMAAELAAAKAAALGAEAEAARAQAMMARQRAQEQADRARRIADQAEAEKRALRRKLLEQFSLALDTRDTERGLVVNMSDVLFDIGKAELRPIAREKLARLGGIVLAYPDLKLQAEGHTDSTGTDEINNRLSRERAQSVHDYLLAQGLPAANVTALGLGSTMPVESNDTRQGRQKNRRVEIIISGSVIGTDVATADRAVE